LLNGELGFAMRLGELPLGAQHARQDELGTANRHYFLAASLNWLKNLLLAVGILH
jgi:hypothetical protein